MEMFFSFVNKSNCLIAQLTLKECNWSDGVKTCGAINLIKHLLPKQLLSLACQNQHRTFNFHASAHCVWHCLVMPCPYGCEALL